MVAIYTSRMKQKQNENQYGVLAMVYAHDAADNITLLGQGLKH